MSKTATTSNEPERHKTFHSEQPDQAAQRTVIRRRCKTIINSSDRRRSSWPRCSRQDEEQVEAEMAQEVSRASANREPLALSQAAPAAEAAAEPTPPVEPQGTLSEEPPGDEDPNF